MVVKKENLTFCQPNLMTRESRLRSLLARKTELERTLLIAHRDEFGQAPQVVVEEIRVLNQEIASVERLNVEDHVSEDKAILDEAIHKQLRSGG